MNSQKKIVLTEPMPLVQDELSILEKEAQVELIRSTDHDLVMSKAKDADVLMVVYAKVTGDIIENASRLKGIIKYGVGVDNIDVRKASENGVIVANVPDYAIETVADHAMGLLLTLARKIMISDRVMRARAWGNWASPPNSLLGIDLKGKTLGLVGIGRIGKAVAERAQSFGMKVTASDPYVSEEMAREMRVDLQPFDEVIGRSDFISLHSPLTDETKGIINAKTISKMKAGVFIINTARGPLIEHTDLVNALREGRVGGAALDVFQKEPPQLDDPIFSLANVVLTPHIAWYTSEALRRLEMTAARQAVEILNGEIPTNSVNRNKISRVK
ncbi:MAG: C-terminal binding protein [Nitrososphaerales archaeon]